MTFSATARSLEAAIAAADMATSAADWREADRQLVLARHLVAVMDVLYPDGAESGGPDLPALEPVAYPAAGCEVGAADPLVVVCGSCDHSYPAGDFHACHPSRGLGA